MEVRKTDANEAGVVEHLPVYSDWLNGIASRYRQSQIKAAISVNAEMLKFYWSLGADIIRMEKDQPWGSKFMQRLSTDLKVSMPDASCFSRVNLYYMVRFFKLYVPPKIVQQVAEQLRSPFEPERQGIAEIGQQVADQLGVAHQGIAKIVQQDAEQLLLTEFVKGYPKVSELIFSVPWGHHMVIIDKFGNDQNAALFYVRKTVENGWSRAILENNIASNLHLRQGQAETNFSMTLADPDSDLAKELLKDPYDFSFIAMDEKYREAELKAELIRNIEQFLQELGRGFSYMGREFKLQVGDTKRAVDMLFYNVQERRYYVIEVKVKKFEPSDIGQIGTYMVAVNRQLKRPDDQQTVGLVICREKDRVTVQYALESSSLPIGVSDYVLERFIPADFKSQLPTVEEVEGELTRRMEIAERHLGGMLADGTGVGLAVGER